MADPALIDYIRKSLESGVSKKDIRRFLLDEGWTEAEISDAMNSVSSEMQVKTFQEQSKKIEKVTEATLPEQKAILGTAVSVIAGLLLINTLLPALVDVADIQNITVSSLESIGISGFLFVILNVALGGLIVAAAYLIYRGSGGKGGLIVITLSIIYFLTSGFALGVILGIIGGLFGIAKK